MHRLVQWYNPRLLRLALFAIGIAISLATGGGLALAGEEDGGP